MRLGREVDDGTGLVFGKQAIEQRAVADVALHENVRRIALERRQRLEIACVSQLVEIDHRLAVCSEPVEYEICADEASAAGNQDHGSLCPFFVCARLLCAASDGLSTVALEEKNMKIGAYP